MGKQTGFMEYQRQENQTIDVPTRLENYLEFHQPLQYEQRKEQAARCMDCGVPFCQSALSIKGKVVGCPLHNLIPEFNDELYHHHMKHALSRLLKTNNFPEFTSRVCPALCEKACINGLNGEPVTVHDNENYIIETAYQEGYMTPRIPSIRSGKKVAVIGSGPSGLAVADQLNQRGHDVTVYEREDAIGGLLMYGIPNMKLEKSIITRRQALMEKEGIVFKTNINVGKDISMQELSAQYEAIVLAIGAKQPRVLPQVSMKTKGVYFAVDYLTASTKSLYQQTKEISAKGKHVVIVGGGDTGNDCVGTALRQKAKSVIQVEMMKEAPTKRTNAWPEWPNQKKVDYGQEEALYLFHEDPRIYETTIKSIKEVKGTIKQVTLVKVYFENHKMIEVENSEKTIPCDLLLIAAGFTGCEKAVAEAFDLELTPRQVIKEQDYHCKDKIFACGDGRTGQSLVVWAIHEGRECAQRVDAFLMGYTTMK